LLVIYRAAVTAGGCAAPRRATPRRADLVFPRSSLRSRNRSILIDARAYFLLENNAISVAAEPAIGTARYARVLYDCAAD